MAGERSRTRAGEPATTRVGRPNTALLVVDVQNGVGAGAHERLEAVLAGLRAGQLVVVGAQTDACIRSALHGALARG